MSKQLPRRVIAPHPRSLAQVVGRSFEQRDVEFLVINLEHDIDKAIYVTAKLALDCDIPCVKKVYAECQRFFKKVDRLITAGDSVSMSRARAMLCFPEPEEFRLGYTIDSSYGSGVGEGKLSDIIFNALCADPELRALLAIEPDALTHIPWIGADRTSDIIATICKNHFIEFTQQQAAFWSFDAACMKTVTVRNVWDSASEQLIDIDVTLPVDDLGRPIIFVWKSMCRSGPALRPSQYFSDYDPDTSGMSGTRKEMMLEDARRHSGRLSDFTADRLADTASFPARRDLRLIRKK